MKKPELPPNEQARLRKLREYEILDTPAEAAFDGLTALAAHIAGVPIALVSLIDVDRQWFKSRYGLDAPETPRDVSFCGHVVASEAPLIVPDALIDERFADNPLVTGGPRVRFYAGVPLRTPDGFVLGTLCTIDHEAREITPQQRDLLGILARQVVDQLELRRQAIQLRAKQATLEADLRKTAQLASLLKLGAEVATAFTTHDELPHMLQACAESLVSNLDAAFARIWTLNTAENVLELRASAGQYTHLDGPHGRVPVGKFKIGLIAEERKPHLTNLVSGDPRVGDQEWARREGMVSFAGYPLLVDDRLVGVLAIFARHALPPTTLEVLSVAATTTAMGICRKETEARLRESEVRARSILDSAVDAVVTIDERGRIDHANPAVERLFGFPAAELLGRNVNVLMPSPDHEQHDGYLASYARTGHRKVIGIGREITASRKDGSTFPAELSVSEFYIEGKKFFTGVVRDISDRKRIERLQSEFVSTVSHELRTPLTSIRGALGLVAGGVTGELPKEAKEYIDIAVSNSDRLVRLINDILDIEKMQSGSMEFRLRTTDLGAAIRSAVAANAAFAAAHRVRLDLPPELPPGEVLVDPDRLAQVLTNLISNAAKFSPPDAAVELAVARIDDRFRIAIRDHGPGIPDEFRGRIFQRFAQADASSTRQKGGTGLGLSISKAIVEKMRGKIGFEPAEGGGTIFFVELPYLPPVAVEAASPGAVRVLVCEDDPDVFRVLEKLLTSSGFAVDQAPTVERARRLLAAHAYDAVTLDLLLADGDGSVLIGEIRSSEATRLTPIIVVSGSSSRLGQAAIMVTDVILKPFEEGRLLAAVKNAVTASRSASPRLLHVEDDEDIRRIVRRTLPESWTVVGADSIQAATKALGEGPFDVVLLDLTLPDGGGDELIGLVGRAQVIIFSATDASADLSRRVTAALVKSVSNPTDVRDTIMSLLSKTRARPERT